MAMYFTCVRHTLLNYVIHLSQILGQNVASYISVALSIKKLFMEFPFQDDFIKFTNFHVYINLKSSTEAAIFMRFS